MTLRRIPRLLASALDPTYDLRMLRKRTLGIVGMGIALVGKLDVAVSY
jgi:hypothetical protein